MVDEQIEQQSIRRRNYFAERDVPCPQCGHNLRDVKGEVCPECGFELRVERGRLVGSDDARMAVEGFGGLVGLFVGIAVFFLLMLPAGLWPDRWAWLMLPQLLFAAGFGYLAGKWCAKRISRSNWVKWSYLDATANAGMLMRWFVWLLAGLFVVGVVYRVVVLVQTIF